ncbi:pentapeptide repeat-containing protein [Marinobacter sp.]|uniref:pentapeptide repeat-containing protein n=1 Tax=Marinobacter sp. TaxID=50741 RepID=UPI003850C472
MEAPDLERIFKAHRRWLQKLPSGERADFSNMDLSDRQFAEEDLSHALFIGTDLRRTQLTNCSLVGAYFIKANLALADFRDSNLSQVVARKSLLNGANFTNTVAEGADFFSASLRGTNFFRTDLTGARLSEADLREASFFESNLDECIFSSKSQLANLIRPLSRSQLEQSIFLDEFSKNSRRIDDDSEERIIVRIGGGDISPYNTSLVLATLNAAYNNIFFLSKYKDKPNERHESAYKFETFDDEESQEDQFERELQAIRHSMTPFFQGVSAADSIFITSVRTGSQIFEIASASAANFPLLAHLVAFIGASATTYSWVTRERKKNHETNKLIAENQKIEAETKKVEMETALISTQLQGLEQAKPELLTSKKVMDQHLDLAVHMERLERNPEFSEAIRSLPIESKIVKANAEELILNAIKPLLSVQKRLSAYNYEITITRKEDNT